MTCITLNESMLLANSWPWMISRVFGTADDSASGFYPATPEQQPCTQLCIASPFHSVASVQVMQEKPPTVYFIRQGMVQIQALDHAAAPSTLPLLHALIVSLLPKQLTHIMPLSKPTCFQCIGKRHRDMQHALTNAALACLLASATYRQYPLRSLQA